MANFGEKMSRYLNSGFEAVELLLKKLMNVLENFRKGNYVITFCVNDHLKYTLEPFTNLIDFIFDFGVQA